MAKQISMFISISLLCILSNAWIVSSFQIGRSPDSTAVNEEETDLFIEENTPIYGSSHGSTGGSAFNDKKDLVLPDRTPCIGVEAVWDSRQLLALRFIYGSDDNAGWSIFHGDSNVKGASREKFMMEPGEKITKITTYVGSTGMSYAGKLITFVLGIQFGTNKGRSSQVFGSEGGEKKVETHDGYVVGYVIGRGGRLLDQLQVVWQSQETVKVNAKNHFTALCPKSPESLTLAIISAFYRNKDKPKLEVKDVGDRVQQRCNNEKSCTLLVDDKILKITPCKSCTKELEVTYTCSSQELIFGPELKDRAYKGHVIMVDREKSVSGVDDVIRCGQYCLKEPRCVGVQIGRNQECYLKSAMEAYTEKPSWISMAVVNRSRDT